MTIDYVMIGRRLKECRVANSLTQEKVAEASDITTVYLSKIENGKVTPTLDTLGAICSVIQADLGYIVTGCQYSQPVYGCSEVLALFRSCAPEVKPVALRLLKELSMLGPQGTQ
ncbi:MAG: helix-turn-helix transcriptional regulator [Oscillospiraceae bacterium]|nr:helix-turn-helix transcriptional regulator [Oscillospiraceae bacterium]